MVLAAEHRGNGDRRRLIGSQLLRPFHALVRDCAGPVLPYSA